MELKKSVVKGMLWTAAEKVGSSLFQVTVNFIILRILMPEVYGQVAVLAAIISIASVFVDSGFSAALIRKKEVTQKEYTAVFIYNISIGVVLYVALLLLTPVIARFYEEQVITTIAPVLLLMIPVNSLANVQTTRLTRKLDFKNITKYTLWGNLIASVAALIMVYSGMGVWTIVAQRLLAPMVRTFLLWANSKWKPSGRITLAPLRSMFGYGSRLLLSDLANAIYNNISGLFIGKQYSTAEFGLYDRAQKQKDTPVSAIVSTIQGVTFPALSKLQDDPEKLSRSASQVTVVMNFLIFPVMVGLIAIAPDLFRVILPDETWFPAIPYFQILCLSGLFVPLSVVSYNLMKIKSDGRIIFRMEIVKKAVATVVLAATLPISVTAIVWGQVVIFLSDAIFNSVGAGRFLPWRLWDRIKEAMPYALISLVMFAAVYGIGAVLSGIVPLLWILVLKIVTGVVVYIVATLITKPKGWREVKEIIDHRKTTRKKMRKA